MYALLYVEEVEEDLSLSAAYSIKQQNRKVAAAVKLEAAAAVLKELREGGGCGLAHTAPFRRPGATKFSL